MWFRSFLVLMVLVSVALPTNATAQNLLPRKVRAPELDGGAWMNTRAPLRLSDLRGKFVVLDFWTYCCINCKHILPELKKLEHEFDKNIVVIGVHSPKFANEEDEDNVREAIVKYDIEHPVVNDAKRTLWRRYEVDTWPSLRIIDPEGNVFAVHEGEIDFKTLKVFFTRQIALHKRRMKLDETPVRFDLERGKREPSPLLYPGKVLADEANQRLYIADSSNHRIVITTTDGRLLAVVGQGVAGDRDGGFAEAQFHDPQGMAFDGKRLYVADTENHKIRLIDFFAKTVSTIAGTGEKRNRPASSASMKPLTSQLSSPWDLLLHNNEHLIIAMAGVHQIWRMNLRTQSMTVMAGNGTEDIIDGVARPRGAYVAGTASLAQPSGLATDGVRLLIADSEGSSIRYMPLDGGQLGTLVGTSSLRSKRLFTFGDQDGPASSARFQHPIGVAYHDSRTFVADTYNNKIRSIDVRTGAVSTLVGNGEAGNTDDPPRLDEPAGISIANNRLYIADTNNHAVRIYDLATQKLTTLRIPTLKAPEPPLEFNGPLIRATAQGAVPAQPVATANGEVQLEMEVQVPAGCKLDDSTPARVRVAWGANSALAPATTSSKSIRAQVKDGRIYAKIPVRSAAGASDVAIQLNYFYCRSGENGFCRPAATQWSGRLNVASSGQPTLKLQN